LKSQYTHERISADIKMAPARLPPPGARPTERLGGQTVDTTKDSAPAHPSPEEKLAKLEDQLAHELMDDEERQELRDRILGLRASTREERTR
jgi:hypothetical protein